MIVLNFSDGIALEVSYMHALAGVSNLELLWWTYLSVTIAPFEEFVINYTELVILIMKLLIY